MRAAAWIISAAVAAIATGPAAAVEDYDACLALIGSDPARAEAEAEAWGRYGGGAAAEHCRALALAALGAERRAAERLARLGLEAPDLPPDARAEILLQAAIFFLDLEEPTIGLDLTEQSLRLNETSEGLTTRARLRAARGEYGAALGDLDAAIARGGPTPDRLVLRASARREEGRFVEARQDVFWALELEPDLPIAYLELGRIEAAQGLKNPARDAFLKAIDLDRGGDVAASARLSLQRMEAGD